MEAMNALVAHILDWFKLVALCVICVGLVRVLLHTLATGRLYRTAVGALVVAVATQCYVEAVTPAPLHLRPDDLLLPVMYALAAAGLWLRISSYKHHHPVVSRLQYRDLVGRFTADAERLQRVSLWLVFGALSLGLLTAGINRVETMQRVQVAEKARTQAVLSQVRESVEAVEEKVEADTAFKRDVLTNQAQMKQELGELKKAPVQPQKQPVRVKVKAASPTQEPTPLPEKKKGWPWRWFSADRDTTYSDPYLLVNENN